MALISEIDYGTPAAKSDKLVELTIDGSQSQRAGRHFDHARGDGDRQSHPEALRDRLCSKPSALAASASSKSKAATEHRLRVPRRSRRAWSCKTQTPRLKALRNGVMELYISDHPLDCLTCAANGNCELQTEAGVVGLREVRYGYAGENHLADKKDVSNPYFAYDPSKCIVCNRCVRACEEVQGTFALTVDGRGFESRISPGQMESFFDSECVSCGACVQACPTATLAEKSLYRHRPAGTFGGHDLRLLRRRLLVQSRDAGRRAGAHGAL